MNKLTNEGKIKLALDLISDAMQTDGSHHKQWYLAQIAQCLLCESVEDITDKYGNIWRDANFVCGGAWQEWRDGFIEEYREITCDNYDPGIAP